MKWLNNLSFVSRIGLAMALSLLLNLIGGSLLKERLSQKEYVLRLDAEYSIDGNMQLLFDTGKGFNQTQQVSVEVMKGQNSLQIPFAIRSGEQLKFLRLDFGNETRLSEVQLKSLSLSSGNKLLFDLNQTEVAKHTGLLNGIEQVNSENANYKIAVAVRPFDPYVVFNPVNELIYPLWQRTLVLALPWVLLLFLPVVNWTRKRFKEKEFTLILTALFLAVIPLKIAWVTFTALLLLAYTLFELVKNRKINFTLGHWAILLLFAVPVLFLGQGEPSKLSIPLGFVLFPVIFSIVDLSEYYDDIKKIYTKVFFLVMSIAIISWALLMCYNGYFYNIDISLYFSDLKSNAHLVMSWLYYSHTTFLSFFILIGGIFCHDLYKRQKITSRYALFYAFFTLCALLILGSRVAWGLGILLSILIVVSTKNLKGILLPLWATLFVAIYYFIDKLDLLRAELWQVSVSEIKKNLWFGHGTGNSGKVLPEQLAINNNGVETLIDINHSHNQFLTYLLENGFLGTLFFIGLMFFIFFWFAKRNNKIMLLITFSILLLMVVESPFKTATPLYLFGFLLSLFMNDSAGVSQNEQNPVN